MKKSLLLIKWKLLITYLAVVAVSMGLIIVITRQLTINSYSQHMNSMQESGMGSMMSSVMTTSLNQAIRDALNSSLIWAGSIAIIVAVLLSLVISRRITQPIHEMAAISGRIAEGDYSQRVDAKSHDEIGRLGESFNGMAESLAEAQRLRRELMANIAHELRTPLTSISGYMEGLTDGVVPADKETYELVHREAQRLSRLVDDLQRLSRAESGMEKLDIINLPVPSILERVSRRLDPQFREKNVELKTAVKNGLPGLLVDEDKLDQILTNLLDNALRYTDSGGQVTLSASGDDMAVNIEIKDNGIGIQPEDLSHIFERFYRADKSRSRERGGTGIGLTIVKRYVEALGGKIRVESNPGEGTSFKLTLPAASS